MEKDVKEILTEDYPDIEEVLVGFKVKESGEEKGSAGETEEKEITNETEKAAIEAERMIPNESGKEAANRAENETANDTKKVL